jgi:hypothetical protein
LKKWLEVKGSQIDTVGHIARDCPEVAAEPQKDVAKLRELILTDSPEEMQWVDEIRMLALQTCSHEDFWRTLVYNRDKQLRPVSRSFGRHYDAWYVWKKLQIRTISGNSLFRDALYAMYLPFSDAYNNFALQRLFFASESGRIGWLPCGSKPGDRVFVLKGMRVPVVLRPRTENSHWWLFIGACYVHGLMDGEAEDMANNRWDKLKISSGNCGRLWDEYVQVL